MKRYVRSWSTAEPSSSDYGKMMDAQRQRLETRYEPFVVKRTYFSSSSANSDGYRITLYPNVDSFDDPMDAEFAPDAEWIALNNGLTFSPAITLYGPFEAGEVRNGFHSGLSSKNGKLIKKFEDGTLDNVMNYLFKTVNFEEFGYDE